MPRLSALNMAEEENWMYDAAFGGHPVRVVVDSFASHNFMAMETAMKFNLVADNTQDVEVELGDGTQRPVTGKLTAVLNINGYLSTESVFLIDMRNEENPPVLILGRSWLKNQNPDINWSNNALMLTRQNGSKVKVLPRTTKNPSNTKTLKKMSFKKLARVLKKGNCELYMARIAKQNLFGI